MVKLHIDWSDVVPDPAVIFSQNTSCRGQEDPEAGEETEGAVPGSEVFLPRDLLVQIDRPEAPGSGQHGEQVEDPGGEKERVLGSKDSCYSYQCSWTLSDLWELWSSEDSGENIAMACDIRRQKAVVMRVGCQENRSEPGTAV